MDQLGLWESDNAMYQIVFCTKIIMYSKFCHGVTKQNLCFNSVFLSTALSLSNRISMVKKKTIKVVSPEIFVQRSTNSPVFYIRM